MSSAAPGGASGGREANKKAISLLREEPGAPTRWWREEARTGVTRVQKESDKDFGGQLGCEWGLGSSKRP